MNEYYTRMSMGYIIIYYELIDSCCRVKGIGQGWGIYGKLEAKVMI